MTSTENSHLHSLAALLSRRTLMEDLPQEAWAGVVQAAPGHGLAPLLFYHLKEATLPVAEGEPWDSLRAAYFRASALYLELERAAVKVERALQAQGIPSIWLKGIALANSIYPHPALRPMIDIDVLVPYPHKEQALAAMQSVGFSEYYDPGRLFGTGDEMGTSHHYHLRDRQNEVAILELHFRLLSEAGNLLPDEKSSLFWERTGTIVLDDLQLRVLNPECGLLYLCAHAALQHGEADFYLLRYFDIHLLSSQGRVNWDGFLAMAAALDWRYPAGRCLQICKDYFDSPIPPEVFAALGESAPDAPAAQRARLLQEPVREWEGLLRQVAALPPRQRLPMVRTLLFPGREYLRRRYSLSPKIPLWLYYPYRWGDLASKFLRVLLARLKAG